MSATELLAEKLKTVTNNEAEVLINCIDGLRGRAPRGRELLQMPREVRRRIFQEQIARAGDPYKQDPGLIIDDKEGPLGHD
jgi:hypothetical protein